MAFRIRKGDTVVVLAGSDKGRTGKVLRVDPRKSRVFVEGAAMQYKHVRRSQKNPKGGRLHREGPLHLSNVALWSEKNSAPQRFRVDTTDKGRQRVGKLKQRDRVAGRLGSILQLRVDEPVARLRREEVGGAVVEVVKVRQRGAPGRDKLLHAEVVEHRDRVVRAQAELAVVEWFGKVDNSFFNAADQQSRGRAFEPHLDVVIDVRVDHLG